MPLYTLTKGSINGLIVNGESVDVKKGDTVDLPAEKAKEYRYLKLVGGPQVVSKEESSKLSETPVLRVADEDEEIEESVDVNSESVDLSSTQSMKATDVIEIIKEIDSLDDLRSLEELEESGQNRVGVLSAIEKRMRQLEGGR